MNWFIYTNLKQQEVYKMKCGICGREITEDEAHRNNINTPKPKNWVICKNALKCIMYTKTKKEK